MPVLINPFRFGAGITGGLVDLQESTLDAASYTYATVNIGSAAANRVVVVGVVLYDGGGSPNAITALTIGGNPATQAANTGSVGTGRTAAMYYLVVAAGATAAVVVTAAAAATSCAIAVWAIYPASSIPVDGVSNEANTAGQIVADNVAVTSGGIVCAVHQHDNAQVTTWSWTGVDPVTEETDQQIGDSGKQWSVATIRPTVSTTTDDLRAAPSTGTPNLSIAAASWGP